MTTSALPKNGFDRGTGRRNFSAPENHTASLAGTMRSARDHIGEETVPTKPAYLAFAAILSTALLRRHAGLRAKDIRPRRQSRHRDQDRQHHACTANRHRPRPDRLEPRRRISARSTTTAASTAARSPSSATTMRFQSTKKLAEQARKLAEGYEVLLIFQSLGTQSNSAIQKYMNVKKVPQLFVATEATKFGRPNTSSRGPWAGSRIIRAKAASTQNTSCSTILGKDRCAMAERRCRQGPDEGTARRPSAIRPSASSPTLPTKCPTRIMDSQVSAAAKLRCRYLHFLTTPKARRRRSARSAGTRLEAGLFHRQHIQPGRQCAQTLPANAKGVISSAYLKEILHDPTWKDDPAAYSVPPRVHGQVPAPTPTRPYSNTVYGWARWRQPSVQVLASPNAGDDLTSRLTS